MSARPGTRAALGAMSGQIFGGLIAIWALATAVFLAIRLVPGDPATLVLGDLADETARRALRARLHFDEALPAQYLRFVAGLARFDLGASLRHPEQGAFARAFGAMAPSASLAGVAVGLGAVGGLAAAVASVGPWLGRARRLVPVIVVGVAAVPLLAFAPVATFVLAVHTRLVPLPGDPSAGWRGALFASSLLALPLGAQVARVARAALLDLGRAQFLDVARAKGAGPLRVWVAHALPAASAPIVAVVATQLGALLGGAVVLERLFERPGLGTLMLDSYAARDVPVLEAAIVVAASLFIGTQAASGALHAALDPRVRGRARG